jgi:hypothetical protein
MANSQVVALWPIAVVWAAYVDGTLLSMQFSSH